MRWRVQCTVNLKTIEDMPTIKRLKDIKPPVNPDRDLDRKRRQKVYQSKMWRNMSAAARMRQPLCPVCLAVGRVKVATDVHHLLSFTSKTGNERDALAHDVDNVIPLCDECHNAAHHGYLEGAATLDEMIERAKAHEAQD